MTPNIVIHKVPDRTCPAIRFMWADGCITWCDLDDGAACDPPRSGLLKAARVLGKTDDIYFDIITARSSGRYTMPGRNEDTSPKPLPSDSPLRELIRDDT